MTEPKDTPDEKAEDALQATIEETASFDDHTEATDEEPEVAPIPGVKTP